MQHEVLKWKNAAKSCVYYITENNSDSKTLYMEKENKQDEGTTRICIIDEIKSIMCPCPDKRNCLPPQRLVQLLPTCWETHIFGPTPRTSGLLKFLWLAKTTRSTTVVHTPPSKVTLKLKLSYKEERGMGSVPGPLSCGTSSALGQHETCQYLNLKTNELRLEVSWGWPRMVGFQTVAVLCNHLGSFKKYIHVRALHPRIYLIPGRARTSVCFKSLPGTESTWSARTKYRRLSGLNNV